MFKDFIDGRGWLTEKGKTYFEENLKKVANELLDEGETDNQLKIIGSVISSFVGTMVADRIQEKQITKNFFNSMSDEEFESYLKNKYGNDYFFKSLTKDEVERFSPLITRRIEKALDEASKNFEIPSFFITPDMNYK